jgi:predicted GNAT family N-acyltransferase
MRGKVESFAKSMESKYDVVLELYYRKAIDPARDSASMQLSAILVKKDKRGIGTGTAVMKEVTHFADDNNLIITLSPSKDFGATSVERLRRFYGQFGFKRNLGRHKDFRFSEAMIRFPVGYTP